MKNIFYLFAPLLLLSCQKDDPVILPDDDMPIIEDTCVLEEMPIMTQDSVQIFWAGTMEHGYAEAIKINKEFKASAFSKISKIDNKLFIDIQTFEGDTIFSETQDWFYFQKIPLASGCYKMVHDVDSTSELNVVEGRYNRWYGGVPIGGYKLLEEKGANYLQVDSLDLENNYIEGKFMVSFVLDNPWPVTVHTPEYIRFLNGRFACKIIE